MQKLFEIRIEFFYIAFFRTIGWLLSGNKVQIIGWQFFLMMTKSLPQPATIRIPRYGVSVLRAD
jgi:hypothetical protein